MHARTHGFEFDEFPESDKEEWLEAFALLRKSRSRSSRTAWTCSEVVQTGVF